MWEWNTIRPLRKRRLSDLFSMKRRAGRDIPRCFFGGYAMKMLDCWTTSWHLMAIMRMDGFDE